jgi:hypothetical protein
MTAADVLREFSLHFGVPFLQGTKCSIGDPLGRDGFLAVRHGLAIDTALEEACELQVEQAALFSDVTPAPFDDDAATLLYAIHELFACTHPQAQSFYARSHTFCRAAEEVVRALPRTFDPGRCVTRHLIVARALSTTRTDVHVKWWTGHADFYGSEPPARLTAWPDLRRVHVDKETAPMWRLAVDASATVSDDMRSARTDLLTALLDCSPLTRVLLLGDPLQKGLPFPLVSTVKSKGKRTTPLDVLEDRRIARSVVDQLLARGLDAAGAMLALTVLQGMREQAPPRILKRAVEVCAHLALAACLIEGEVTGSPECVPLRAVLDEGMAKLNEATRVYWAMVAAAAQLDVVAVPVDALTDNARAVWERLLVRLAHPRVLAVSEPLRRELGRRLPLSLLGAVDDDDVTVASP